MANRLEYLDNNLSNWKAESGSNILFITGLFGSGKTTLSEKYNAEVIHLDDCTENMTGEDTIEVVNHLYKKDKLFVVEGVQLLQKLDYNYFLDRPLVMMNTRHIISIYRKERNETNFLRRPLFTIKFYTLLIKQIELFKKELFK